MFDNIIGQNVIAQIIADLEGQTLPPSILFTGPEAAAKGTTALELSRVLSCEAVPDFDRNLQATWGCSCPACNHHRTLSHPDLIALGPRSFQAEITACRSIFLKEPQLPATRTLFSRAVRKLLLRFSPVLWEGDAKISKLNKPLETIYDLLEDITSKNFAAGLDDKERQKLEKTCDKIAAACTELEAEGISAVIPVALIRRASYWLRTAPKGRHKTLIIENADRMNDAARNSLLKILEEPPEAASIILSTTKPKALLPTILSRVRPYPFVQRGIEEETSVLKRVFRMETPAAPPRSKETPVRAFLDAFLPASGESLAPAAAYFWSSLAALAITQSRRSGATDSPTLTALGAYCAPLAETGGLPRHDSNIKKVVDVILKAAAKFEPRSLFSLFISLLYNTSAGALRGQNNPEALNCRALVRKCGEEARLAVEVYNQPPVLALERLAETMRRGLSDLGGAVV